MAIALAWGGRVDLDLRFDEFFNGNHTISAWFMPQYPDSYINPIVGVGLPEKERPTTPPFAAKPPQKLGFFLMGTGEYLTSEIKGELDMKKPARMFLRVGSSEENYEVILKPDAWHHVAVVRSGSIFTMFLNGTALSPAIIMDIRAPSGVPVRLGQTSAWRHVFAKRPAQFYGLIDDVAFFTEALTATQISKLAKKNTTITGAEPSLLAAWLFSKKTEPAATLNRNFTLGGAVSKVFEAQPRNDKTDAELQPLPPLQFRFALPFLKQRLILVCQSPKDLGGSHVGGRNFPFDFAAIELGKKKPKIAGVPFRAVSDGTVVDPFRDGNPSGKVKGTNTIFTSVDGMPGFFWKHLHWETRSAKVAVGTKVKAGDILANAGDTGVEVDNFHLHTALVFFPDDGVPEDTNDKRTVSVPVAFTNYFVLNKSKDKKGQTVMTWEPVDVGVPDNGQILIWGMLVKQVAFDNHLVKSELLKFRNFALKNGLGTHEPHKLT